MPLIQCSLDNTQYNPYSDLLHGWSNTTSTQYVTVHTMTGSPPARLCPQFHLGQYLTELAYAGHDMPTPTYVTSIGT